MAGREKWVTHTLPVSNLVNVVMLAQPLLLEWLPLANTSPRLVVRKVACELMNNFERETILT